MQLGYLLQFKINIILYSLFLQLPAQQQLLTIPSNTPGGQAQQMLTIPITNAAGQQQILTIPVSLAQGQGGIQFIIPSTGKKTFYTNLCLT